MTKKETALYKVVDIVIDNCATTKYDGTKSITRDIVLSRSRKENVVEARALITMILVSHGYSTTTIAEVLLRTPEAVRNLLKLGYQWLDVSRAFKMIYKECSDLCREVSF